MKIDNLSNMAQFSEVFFQKQGFSGQGMGERSIKTINSQNTWQDEAFSTPSFKGAPPNSFVAQRSNYALNSDNDFSPLPDAFNNVVDEDVRMKMNKGHVADLDSILMTPAIKVPSLSSDGVSPAFSRGRFEQEIHNLKKQLDLTIIERDEFEKKYMEQVSLNDKLIEKVARLSKEVPQMLSKSVTTCKDVYNDVLSVMQSSVNNEKSFAKNLLTSMTEVGGNLFSTLETRCSMVIAGHITLDMDNTLLQDQCKILCERLNNTVAMLSSSNAQITIHDSDSKVVDFREEPACWKDKLSNELNIVKDKYVSLEKDLDQNKQVLEWNSRCLDLERALHILEQERDALNEKVSKSSENLTLVSREREMLLERYNSEVHKRQELEKGFKEFSMAFTSRQRSLQSFQSDFKSKIEDLKSQNPLIV